MKYASVVSRFAQVLAVLALPVACAAGPTEEELGASEGELNQAGPLCPDARCGSGTQCCLDTTNKKLTCSASCAPKNKIQCRSPRDCDGTCCADVDLSVGFLFLSVSVNSVVSMRAAGDLRGQAHEDEVGAHRVRYGRRLRADPGRESNLLPDPRPSHPHVRWPDDQEGTRVYWCPRPLSLRSRRLAHGDEDPHT